MDVKNFGVATSGDDKYPFDTSFEIHACMNEAVEQLIAPMYALLTSARENDVNLYEMIARGACNTYAFILESKKDEVDGPKVLSMPFCIQGIPGEQAATMVLGMSNGPFRIISENADLKVVLSAQLVPASTIKKSLEKEDAGEMLKSVVDKVRNAKSIESLGEALGIVPSLLVSAQSDRAQHSIALVSLNEEGQFDVSEICKQLAYRVFPREPIVGKSDDDKLREVVVANMGFPNGVLHGALAAFLLEENGYPAKRFKGSEAAKTVLAEHGKKKWWQFGK